MEDHEKTQEQLIDELEQMRRRVAGLETSETEIRRTEQALRESEERFRTVAEYTYDWECWRGLDGVPIFVSPSCQRITGYRPEEFVADPALMETIAHPDDRALVARHVRDELVAKEPISMDFRIITRQGEERWIEHVCQPVYGVDGRHLGRRGSNRDVTERKRAEHALRKEHDFISAVLDTAGALVVVLDPQGQIVQFNRACERTTGYTFAKVKGKRLWDVFLTAEETEPVQAVFRQLQAGQFPSRHENFWVAKDGGRRRIEWSNTALLGDQGAVEYIVGTGLDITERKEAEEQLRKAHDELEIRVEQRTAELVTANATLQNEISERIRAEEELRREQRLLRQSLDLHEQERQLVAYEIHDGLAQQLSGASLQLQAYGQLQESNPEEAQKAFLVGMQSLQHAMEETRRLINGLRPPILDESGVVAALDSLIRESRELGPPQIEFAQNLHFRRLAPPLETAIFRIVQESLSNARRHSGSDKLQLNLFQHGDCVRVEIQDRGSGFDVQFVGENCFGLDGIRERARLLGGHVTIDSGPGKGTRIAVELPLVQGVAAGMP